MNEEIKTDYESLRQRANLVIAIKHKQTGELTELFAAYDNKTGAVICIGYKGSENKFVGKEVYADEREKELLSCDINACSTGEPDPDYMVVYVNDLHERICGNCIYWNERAKSGIGKCKLPTHNSIAPSPCGLTTYRNFGCNRFTQINK